MGAEAIPSRHHFAAAAAAAVGAGTFVGGLDLSAGNRTPFASRRQRGPHTLVEPVVYIIRAPP